MRTATIIIVIHQVLFQGMFFAKNILLRRKLGLPIRGRNPEAVSAIVFIGLFLLASIVFGSLDVPMGTLALLRRSTASVIALILLTVSLFVAAASLLGLRDSWRVGIVEDQHTDLVEEGIYRFSRNPYFLSYLFLFAGYTILLQNVILLFLSMIGCAFIHVMVMKEEKHLAALHGEKYLQYKKRVPRYFII